MPKCTVMIGLPALGKSTFIKKIKTPDIWIYSSDMYIDAVAEDNGITYADAFESNIAAAIEFNDRKLASMMKLRTDIIWDQTNLGVEKRQRIIKKMREADYQVNAICLLPPQTTADYDEWKRRLNSRPGKIIPFEVLANMIETFVMPNLEEGFDKIDFYDMYGN